MLATSNKRLRNALRSHDGVEKIRIIKIDSFITFAIGLIPKSGSLVIYAISRQADSINVVIVRDGKAHETMTLMAVNGLKKLSEPMLFGSFTCFSHDIPHSDRIHIVYDDKVLFDADVACIAPYAGHVDKIQNGRIYGWAVDFGRSPSDTKVELLIDGIPYATRSTIILRPDVNKTFPGRALSGFEFNVILDDLPWHKVNISVRISESSYILDSREPYYEPKRGSAHILAPLQLQSSGKSVSVIVPIYNAPQELRECINSLLIHTNFGAGRHRLILSDDASPDPEVGQVLNDYENYDGFIILRNSINKGYTGNINYAISVAKSLDPEGDVILLNSDTRVTPQWLELLQRCAMQRPSIGTVSAVSDNAGAFSMPQKNSSNPVPAWMNEDDYARLVTHVSALTHLRVPTTSGFCMYIRQKVFADIGLFDAENFSRGYGEENDFCMRAGHIGWEHVIADNVIVYHERSASFLGSKNALMDRASNLIPEMYPEYSQAVYQAFSQSPDINLIRFKIQHGQLRHTRLPRPRVAFVIGVESGGTPQTNMDLMSSIQTDYEPYLILSTTGTLRIFRIVGEERIEVEKINLGHRVMPIAHDSDSYRTAIADILQRYAFELVHIRHIGRHGLSLIRIARDLSIPVLFSLHDFYTVCPNVKLLDAENRYCAGRCTEGGSDCNIELWDGRYTPPLKRAWVYSWQTIFRQILPLCNGLITTSPYARDLIRSIYGLEDTRFDVIPHARDFDNFSHEAAPLAANEPLRVFVPGNIVPAKGLDLIHAIKELDIDNKIEFHFAGTCKVDLSRYGVYHGPYERANFGDVVKSIQPHVGAVLSIWPETYSHTLTELWSCGVPVVTSSYGATGERVAEHGGGWALTNMDPALVFAFFVGLSGNSDEIETRQTEVMEWQLGYGRDYSIAIMAERYKRLYRQTLRRAPGRELEAVVLPFGGQLGASQPTTHLNELLDGTGAGIHVMVWPTPTLHMLDKIGVPDHLVIRYHDEPSELADPCKDLADAQTTAPGMKLVLEMAADAIALPMAEDYLTVRPALVWLLANADLIIGPAELIAKSDMLRDIDLASMVPQLENMKHLPNLALPAPASLLPAGSSDASAIFAQRLEAEVVDGGSACIFRHNEALVAANFTLIDWNAMLGTPRIPGMVSLIMPTFNRVGLTEKFLRSILSITQETTEYEIIIVDNGSVSEARDQIKMLAGIDPRVRVVCANTPLMFSVGCNYGASFARGEYILFVNNDMEAIEADWLDALIKPLREQPKIGITGGRLLFSDRTIQHAGLVFSNQTNMAYHAYLGEPHDAPHVCKQRIMQAVTGACMALRATDWAKLRGFNPLFLNGCEDVDLCLRMKRVLQRDTLYVPECLLLHLEGKSPGRGRFILPNRLIFSRLWGEFIKPDDQSLYSQDGFKSVHYTAGSPWLAKEYQTVSVSLSS
ncbi:Glycosyltransferase, GT2 family [Loktanella atrilutea]|uniref:Glycosyltransferase, GT2 family n=2 Tax=Loktanella atrilutea TaxID=366533 RepID=A0A1M5EL76_LOKAT|nr:Glycosyltransferase, GT2 family [Loktanella atrilutea]